MLVQALFNCRQYLPKDFSKSHERFFQDEHLQKFSDRLYSFWKDGVPDDFPPPTIEVESTPPLVDCFSFFKGFMDRLVDSNQKIDDKILKLLADSLVKAGTKHILVLLGQRLTPASITDYTAIPQNKTKLMASANEIHSSRLSVAARALTKHVNRENKEFWGEIVGNDQHKNELAQNILNEILNNCTWWNVFGHYKHEIVYEARVAVGNGARWGKDGQRFIGFLEPFTPGFPHIR